MVIYCTADRHTRYERMIKRGDDYAEVIRRLGADDRDFADFTGV
jgi:dephospho-CoA kinase